MLNRSISSAQSASARSTSPASGGPAWREWAAAARHERPGLVRRWSRAYAVVVIGPSAMGVEPAHPPAAMMRVSNPVMRGLLRSPAGGPMRRQFMVLRFFGRKTGRRYDIPVVAHRLDGELYALTDAAWRNNFRDGADVEVTLDGHVTRMRGQLLDDPEAVAPLYVRAIGHFGVKRAQRMLGLKIHTPGTPATDALAEAARRYHLSAIQLTAKT